MTMRNKGLISVRHLEQYLLHCTYKVAVLGHEKATQVRPPIITITIILIVMNQVLALWKIPTWRTLMGDIKKEVVGGSQWLTTLN